MLGDYAAYVISAYAIVFATMTALVVWTVLSRRAARRELARAERAMERIDRAH